VSLSRGAEHAGASGIAITREVSPEIDRCELSFLPREAIDLARAVRQHDRYCLVLESLGLHVLRLPAEPGCPDCCFVEDAAIVLDEIAILTAMGAPSRRAESKGVAAALRPYRRVIEMTLPSTLDGGDLLRVGRRLFISLSARTNADGVLFVREALGPLGYNVIPLETKGCLHLKSAVTSLGGDRVLVNAAWLDPSSLSGLEILTVPPEEPEAANVLEVRGEILVHSGFERTMRLLEAEGFRVRPLDVSEFLKAEAGLTCKSVLFRVT
jgi:dimethylargininase